MLLEGGGADYRSQRELYFVQGVCANDDKQHEELSQLHYQTLPHGNVSELIIKTNVKQNHKGQHDDGGSGNALA